MEEKLMDADQSMDVGENPILKQTVEPDTDLKNIILEYIGEKLNPEDQNITVEMIVDTMMTEFPEFLMAVAEENWIRGYHQALTDVEKGWEIDQENKENTKENISKNV